MSNDLSVQDKVLFRAWAQLSVYDSTASKLKQQGMQLRSAVIFATVVATVASSLAALLGSNSIGLGHSLGLFTVFVVGGILWLFYLDKKNPPLRQMLKRWQIFALVAVVVVCLVIILLTNNAQLAGIMTFFALLFPLIGTALINDMNRFVGKNEWIRYRFVAESIRKQIYLYRMRAGVYYNHTPEAVDDVLVKELRNIQLEGAERFNIPPEKEPTEADAIDQAIRDAVRYTQDDDGMVNPTLEQYVIWRLDSSRQWYDVVIHRDFSSLRKLIRLAQTALLVGASLSFIAGLGGLQLVVLAAVTNALASAFTQLSFVNMSGVSYGLFMLASRHLSLLRAEYEAMTNNTGFAEDAKAHADFVLKVENLLEWERKEWFELALQAQQEGDDMILKDLTRLTERANAALKSDANPVGLDEITNPAFNNPNGNRV